jgi:hypothetical protein
MRCKRVNSTAFAFRCREAERRPAPASPQRAAINLRNYSRIGVFTHSFAAKCRGDGERQHQPQKRSVQSRTRRDGYAQVHGTSFGGGRIRDVHDRSICGDQCTTPSPASSRSAPQAAPPRSEVSLSASARYPSSLCVLTGNGLSHLTAFQVRPACSCVLHLTLPGITI